MGDAQFIDRRRASIGGSEISGVMGVNPYVSPIDIFLEKTGKKEPFGGSLTTLRGNYLEPLVAAEYSRATGYDVRTPYEMELPDNPNIIKAGDDVIFLHPKYSFLRATIDRFALTPFGGTYILEIKTAVGWGTNKFQDGVPLHYEAQAIWNRGIADFFIPMLEDTVHVPVLLDDKYDCFAVQYSEEVFNNMVNKAVQFWNEHILKDIPPDITSLEDCKLLYPDTDGSSLPADDNIIDIVKSLAEIKEGIADAEKALLFPKESLNKMKALYEQKELELRMTLGAAQYVRYDDKNLVTYSPVIGRTYFDIDAFQTDEPELYQKYLKRKPGGRQLRINYKVLGDQYEAH